MKFFYRLEARYGRYAIRNLMYYIIIMYAVGLAVMMFNPMLYWEFLSLDPQAIMQGQVWRLITFMICPPTFGSGRASSLFFGIIALSLYYSIGQSLERVWGSFRFNVYFFMGVIGNILATMVGWLVFGQSFYMTTEFINFSLFLAFALTFPETQFLMFFVIPVKVKWLALAECAVYAYMLLIGSASIRCEILISLFNVIVFLIITGSNKKFDFQHARRKHKFQTQAQPKIVRPGQTRHKCAVCGKTELDGADLEFRYCSKCEGNYEYCQDHLYTHIHVTKDSTES